MNRLHLIKTHVGFFRRRRCLLPFSCFLDEDRKRGRDEFESRGRRESERFLIRPEINVKLKEKREFSV